MITAVDRYAVVGNPVAHSKSPLIHEAFARATVQAMSYERLLAPIDGFARGVDAFAADRGKGLNVTIPFKLEAFALARELSPRAAFAQACNTLAWRGDHWYGDNTDGAGLLRDIAHNLDVRIDGRDVLVLGAGGAARGILAPLLGAAPRALVVANRTQSRAAMLAAQFAEVGPVSAIAPSALAGRRFDVVINATSIGLGSTVPRGLWPEGLFAQGAFAYDLVYANERTPFVAWARAQGVARTADGLGMLIEQAAESFALWRGVRPDTAPVFALLRA
ncbi:MAG: shikimate dehydrogenase [Betaproteobacteria bacterium]